MTPRPFPSGLDKVGACFALSTCFFAARIAWEHTVLTWTSGPQMVGFTLMHSGLGVLMYLIAVIAGPVWILATIYFAWRSRSLGTSITRIAVVAFAAAWALLIIPAGYWERLFIIRMSQSPHAQDLLYYASVRGEIATVKTYLDHGLSINSKTCSEALTPTHGASRSGNAEMLKFLISRGADVNLTNIYGDSPLCDAEGQHRAAAIDILERHGARRIVGRVEQRRAGITHSVTNPSIRTPHCAVPSAGVLSQPNEPRCADDRWRIDR